MCSAFEVVLSERFIKFFFILKIMANYVEKKGTETQAISLRKMLEDMAKELSLMYSGEIVVGRCDGLRLSDGYYGPSSYLAEIGKNRFLGIFPGSKRLIFAAGENLGSLWRPDEVIYTCLLDNKAEAVVKKHLGQYIKEHNINKIEMQRGFSAFTNRYGHKVIFPDI